jgi:hypothetical protein
MIEQILSTITAKDALVVLGAAISTYFIAREARREARAANRRLDRLIDGPVGRPGVLDRVTSLEEGRKTDRVELLRVRDNAHFAINSIGAVIGFTDHALDIVGDAVGRELPHPQFLMPKRSAVDDDQGGKTA